MYVQKEIHRLMVLGVDFLEVYDFLGRKVNQMFDSSNTLILTSSIKIKTCQDLRLYRNICGYEMFTVNLLLSLDQISPLVIFFFPFLFPCT